MEAWDALAPFWLTLLFSGVALWDGPSHTFKAMSLI